VLFEVVHSPLMVVVFFEFSVFIAFPFLVTLPTAIAPVFRVYDEFGFVEFFTSLLANGVVMVFGFVFAAAFA
jgi:hypothetical protein